MHIIIQCKMTVVEFVKIVYQTIARYAARVEETVSDQAIAKYAARVADTVFPECARRPAGLKNE